MIDYDKTSLFRFWLRNTREIIVETMATFVLLFILIAAFLGGILTIYNMLKNFS